DRLRQARRVRERRLALLPRRQAARGCRQEHRKPADRKADRELPAARDVRRQRTIGLERRPVGEGSRRAVGPRGLRVPPAVRPGERPELHPESVVLSKWLQRAAPWFGAARRGQREGMKTRLITLLCLALVLPAAASARQHAGTAVSISGAGSTFVAPLVSVW